MTDISRGKDSKGVFVCESSTSLSYSAMPTLKLQKHTTSYQIET